jgi:hypothetical protein
MSTPSNETRRGILENLIVYAIHEPTLKVA